MSAAHKSKGGAKGGNSDSVQADLKNLNLNSKKKPQPEEEEDDDEDNNDDDQVGEEDDNDMELPPVIMKRVEAVRKLHTDIEAIDEEYKAERIQLEAKYYQKRSIIYEGRKNIITGVVDVKENDSEVVDVDGEKGIPNFWLQAFGNHPVIADIICEHDIPALAFLQDVRCTYSEDYATFHLTFEFQENPYFSNKVLIKKYTLEPYLLDDRNPSLTGSEGTEIQWKAGKNLTVNEVKKKQKAKSGKNKGQVRTIVKEIPCPSFFRYFSDPKEAGEDEDEDENEEGEEKERIELDEEEDFEIAHTLRTAVIPDAVLWFTGEAHYDEEDDDEADGDDDDDDDDDIDDGDIEGEDDEDDDKDEVPKGAKSKLKHTSHQAGGFAAAPTAGNTGKPGEQPECKQN